MKQLYIAFLFLVVQFGFAKDLLAPTATISGPSNVCLNATGQVITFTGIGGTAPYTFTYTVTGSPGNQTIQTVSGSSVTLPIVTSPVGSVTYTLVSVHDAATPAEQTVTGQSVIVTVNSPPTVNFTFTNDNTCFPVQFNAIVGSGTYTYSWNFNDSTPNATIQNSQHLFESSGVGTQTFNVELTITNTLTNCTNSIIRTVTVLRRPSSALNTSTTDGATFYDTAQNIFLNCGATASSPNFDFVAVNASTTIATNTSYTIDWDDSSPDTTTPNFTSLQHTYTSLGFFNISITTLNSVTGCSSTKVYRFFNGNSPAGNLGSLGNADDCAPYSLTWPVQNTSANPPGTTYEFSVNDSSTPQTFNQNTLPTTITHNFTQSSCGLPGNKFTVTFKITNPCNENITTTQVQVAQKPVASFSINPGLNVCTNNVVAFTNTSVGNYVSGSSCLTNFTKTWTITPNTGWNLTVGSLNGTDIINVIFTTPGNYTISLNIRKPGSQIARCTDDTVTRTICVEPPLSPSFTVNTISGCIPLTVTTNNTTVPQNPCTPPVYTWSVSHSPTNCGTTIPQITNQTGINASFNFTEAGTYVITLTGTNACSPAQTTTQTVTVRKPPTVAITTIPAQCQNVPFTPLATLNGCPDSSIIRYLWTFTGGTPGTAATAVAPPVSYAATGNYTISLEVENGCGTTTATSNSFAVQPAPFVQNETLSVCSGVPFSVTPSTATAGNIIPVGTTYSWSAPTPATPITGGASGTDQASISGTLVNPTNLPQTVTYTVTPKFGSCLGVPFTVTVTVNPSPVVTFSAAPQTICSGDTSAAITLTSVAGATLSWTVIPPAGISGISTLTGANTIPAQTLINTTNAPILVTYNASATTSGSSTCAGAVYPYTITVNPSPSITENFTSTVCSGVAFTVSPSNSALNTIPTGTTYSWPAPTATGGMTGSAGSLQPSISGTLNNPTDTPQTATYSVTPTTNGCLGIPFTITVTVNPKPSLANVIPPAICSGTSFAVTPANGGGNIVPVGTTYTWTISSNSNVTGQGPSGTTGVTTISQTLTNITNTNQVVTYTVTPTSGTCPGSTFTITVTVNPKPSIANITPAAFCSGGSFTVTPANGGADLVPVGTTYTWPTPVSNPIGAIAGGSDQLTGVSSISQTLTNITNNTATITYIVTPASGTCVGTPFTIDLTVNPTPVPLSLANQSYCNGIPTTPISFTNAVTGTSYVWTNSDPSIGLSGTGNGDIPIFTPTNTTNFPIVATVSVIASANGCPAPAQTFTITVNPAPTVLFSPSPQTLCSGGSSVPVTLSSTITGATLNWTVIPPSGITGIINTNGANTIPTETLINTTNSPITVTYEATATTSSGSTCAGAVYTYTIVVNPIPSVTEIFTPIVCSDVAFTITPDPALNSIPAGTTYSWAAPVVTGGMTGGSSGTAQTSVTGTLNNPTANSQTALYTVTPSFNGCPGTAFTVSVTVNPKPSIANLATTICSDDAFTITPASAGADIVPTGTSYTWMVSTNPDVTGQAPSGTPGVTAISQLLVNSSSISQIVAYTVTPISGSCPGSSFDITVTVNPKPSIANATPAAICSGNSFSVTPVSGGSDIVPIGTTYTWTNPVSSPPGSVTGGSAQPIGQGTISQTLTNTTNTIATLTYTVTPVSGTCIGAPFTITVTLSPIPVISPQSTTICSTNTFTVSPTATGGDIVPSLTTYTWTTPSINPPGAVTGATSETVQQANISQALINTTTSPATVTYTVTPTSGTCVGNSFTVTVTVNPAINPNIILTNNACFGVNIASITTNVTGGIPFSTGTPYQYTWSGPNSFSSIASGISNLAPGNYNLTIADAGNCPFTGVYTITEPTDIVITVDSENDVTCYSANDGSVNITVTGGTGNYVYTWTRNTNPFAATEDIANLTPGNYTLSVTDANNCGPRTMSFTITEPPLLVVSLASQTNVLCYGASTGAITVNVLGGTPGSGYAFSWSGPNGFTSNNQNLIGIAAGTYDLTVTDANNCIKTLSVIITQSTEIVIAYTTTPITCYGANNASLTVTLSGGNPPYTFQWNNLATGLSQTNLSAGNYIITVTDNVGCIQTQTIVIPDAPVFTVNPIVTNVTCKGANNGSINLNLTGGIAPVALTWSDGSTAGLIRNNLPPGTYTATISDGTPCFIVRTFTIVEPQSLVLSANITNAFDCTVTNSGAIDLVVAGGTLPYSYNWTTGAVIEDLANLTSGNYAVTVTDANSCTANAQYSVVRQDPIAITVATQTDFDCAAHTVEQNFVASASGGIPPYQFQWSSGIISGANNEIMNTNTNGTVLLTVTDSNSCTATYTVTVDTPILGYPSFDTTSYGFVTYGIYAIEDPIQFQSTITGDYVSVSWDFGDGTFSTDLNPVHTYLIPKDYVVTQTVTYPFGCVYVQTITLLIEKGYVLVVPTAYTPNNDGLNDTFRPVTKGLKNVVLDIYDTWGSLIFSETGDVLVGWDGKIKGFNAENGNYYSKVRAETFYGTVVNSNQTFVLIK